MGRRRRRATIRRSRPEGLQSSIIRIAAAVRRRESTISYERGRLEPPAGGATEKATRGAGLGPIYATKEVGEEVASKDANGEDGSEKSDVKEADDSKESSKED